ncbi:MAG TPA: phosphoglycerate mutase family protein [Chitinophagaceae bacterium]|nr:phosphoglycerate mutase family protein [Chitinophagaceae bacterium]
MKYIFLILTVAFASCSHTYYIVRHAEKAANSPNMMSNDVPLSDKGKQRAEALKDALEKKKIAFVFSTNFIRTTSTVQPTADYFRLITEVYGPTPDAAFISKLKSLKKNVLVVGHSNTVDDIVNMLCGKTYVPGDLKESDYDNLFIVKKKGKRCIFSDRHYGEPSK